MRGYLDLLRSPAGRLMAASGVARLAWGISGLALIVHVERAADSYAAAGLAVGALGLTSAVLAPPFTAWTRAGLARRLHGAKLQRAYTVDNIFEESAFVFGPLVAGLVIVVASAGTALIVASALTVAVGLGAGIGFVEVAVTAFAEGEGSQAAAGIVFSALSAGGIAGALVYGSRSWPLAISRQYALLLGAAAVGLGALALAESVLAMTVLIAIAGLAFTPTFVANSLLKRQRSGFTPPSRPVLRVFTRPGSPAANLDAETAGNSREQR